MVTLSWLRYKLAEIIHHGTLVMHLHNSLAYKCSYVLVASNVQERRGLDNRRSHKRKMKLKGGIGGGDQSPSMNPC